jgi:hypothetical protein
MGIMKTDFINWTIIFIFGLVIMVVNYWVWFKPHSFLAYIKKAKRSPLVKNPDFKGIMELIDSSMYIWLARFVFAVAMGVYLFMIIYIVQ